MIRKSIMFILATLLICLAPVSAFAAPTPLIKQRNSSAVVIMEESPAQVISYTSNYSVNSQVTQVQSNIIIENVSSDSSAEFFMGIPAYLDQNTLKVNDLEVVIDGKKQGLAKRRNQTDPENTVISDLPDHWMAWYMSVKPNESKVIDISYTIDTPREENGTESVFIPLEYLNAWTDLAENIEINVLFDSAPPYIFEPNSTSISHDYDGNNSLTWVYNNEVVPRSIKLFYRPINNVVATYLKNQNPNDWNITSIVDDFINKSYNTVITNINSYLESYDGGSDETSLKNELLYVSALSYQGLYQYDKAMDIFNQIEDKPMFGELEGTLKNKLIFDKYNYLQLNGESDTNLYDYLNSSKNFVMNNTIFLNWLENESSELTPPPTPSPEPTVDDVDPADSDEQEEKENDDNLVTHVSIGGVDIAVEYIFISALILIILLFLIFRKKNRKYTSRYLFK